MCRPAVQPKLLVAPVTQAAAEMAAGAAAPLPIGSLPAGAVHIKIVYYFASADAHALLRHGMLGQPQLQGAQHVGPKLLLCTDQSANCRYTGTISQMLAQTLHTGPASASAACDRKGHACKINHKRSCSNNRPAQSKVWYQMFNCDVCA
jgi:hypothetical protein